MLSLTGPKDGPDRRRRRRRLVLTAASATLALALGAGLLYRILQPTERAVVQQRTIPPPSALTDHCEDDIGPPRVIEVTNGVWVAIGYDLANTILVATEDGNVVIDVGMSPERARTAKEALLARAPGRTAAIVYTHSHIDHVGGASAWVEPGTEIWATDAFAEHFVKQYARLRPAEARRGARQFGVDVDDASLPCAGIGRRIDLAAAGRTGVRMPTRTFTGEAVLEVGGVRIELTEAHGETHDHLFVWVPSREVLLPGDDYYRAFPNLYTIRGTSPRPVDAWVASIDAMRRRSPAFLVPSHTVPVVGREAVAETLTRYRDGIQWVRDRVVQAANEGVPLDTIAETVGLPPGLADAPSLQPFYGQVDWSARAIYSNELGWFDGRPEALYPMETRDRAAKTVALMGGVERVWAEADGAIEGDPRWALHLLSLLGDSELATVAHGGRWATAKARALESLATGIGNANGRGYLLESAWELRGGVATAPLPEPDDALLDAIPVRTFFDVMASRLVPERSIDAHESVSFTFTDTGERFVVTVRRGIAEVVEGDPLPGTPAPVADVRTTTAVWRRLAADLRSPVSAVTSGDLSVGGDPAAFYTFTRRFRRGL